MTAATFDAPFHASPLDAQFSVPPLAKRLFQDTYSAARKAYATHAPIATDVEQRERLRKALAAMIDILAMVLAGVWNFIVNVCRRLCGMSSLEQEQQARDKAFVRDQTARENLESAQVNKVSAQLAQQALKEQLSVAGLGLAPSAVPGVGMGPSTSRADLGGAPVAADPPVSPRFKAAQIGPGPNSSATPGKGTYRPDYDEDLVLRMAERAFEDVILRLTTLLANPDRAMEIMGHFYEGQGEKAITKLLGPALEEMSQSRNALQKILEKNVAEIIVIHAPDHANPQASAHHIINGLPDMSTLSVLSGEALTQVAQYLSDNYVEMERFSALKAGAILRDSAQANDFDALTQVLDDSLALRERGRFDQRASPHRP